MLNSLKEKKNIKKSFFRLRNKQNMDPGRVFGTYFGLDYLCKTWHRFGLKVENGPRWNVSLSLRIGLTATLIENCHK